MGSIGASHTAVASPPQTWDLFHYLPHENVRLTLPYVTQGSRAGISPEMSQKLAAHPSPEVLPLLQTPFSHLSPTFFSSSLPLELGTQSQFCHTTNLFAA